MSQGQRSRSKFGQVKKLITTLFFEYFIWINIKLGVKEALGLPLSYLVLIAIANDLHG
jgi:hypothetical protein